MRSPRRRSADIRSRRCSRRRSPAKMRERAARLLHTTTDRLRADHPGLRIETVQQDGPPVPVLMDQSRKAFATVVGADGVGRLSGVFFGSVSARLAEHGHGCIVIARPESVDTADRTLATSWSASTDLPSPRPLSVSRTRRPRSAARPWSRSIPGTTSHFAAGSAATRWRSMPAELTRRSIGCWRPNWPDGNRSTPTYRYRCGSCVVVPRRTCSGTQDDERRAADPTHRGRQPGARRIHRAVTGIHQSGRDDPRRLLGGRRPHLRCGRESPDAWSP